MVLMDFYLLYLFFLNRDNSMLQARFELQTPCPLQRSFTIVLIVAQTWEIHLAKEEFSNWEKKVRFLGTGRREFVSW